MTLNFYCSTKTAVYILLTLVLWPLDKIFSNSLWNLLPRFQSISTLNLYQTNLLFELIRFAMLSKYYDTETTDIAARCSWNIIILAPY